jgi:hypothetical protein
VQRFEIVLEWLGRHLGDPTRSAAATAAELV